MPTQGCPVILFPGFKRWSNVSRPSSHHSENEMQFAIPHSSHPVTRILIESPNGDTKAEFDPSIPSHDFGMDLDHPEVGITAEYLNDARAVVATSVVKVKTPSTPPASTEEIEKILDEEFPLDEGLPSDEPGEPGDEGQIGEAEEPSDKLDPIDEEYPTDEETNDGLDEAEEPADKLDE